MMKKILAIFTSIAGLFVFAVPMYAHVIVHPSTVGIAAIQDFTVNVPNEKDNPVVSVRLLIPDNVTSVVPYVMAGWTITTKTNGSGDNTPVTEIDWNNGSIPVGQAEQLGFQAQVPPKPTTLAWKAYQTYQDGTVVSWDLDPATMKNLSDEQQDALADKENKGEYSTTTVLNDLTGSRMTSSQNSNINTVMASTSKRATLPYVISIAALALSVVGIGIALRKK